MNLWLIAGIAASILLVAFALYALYGRSSNLPPALRPGERLPTFSAEDEQGNPVSSVDLAGSPAVILFVRGNWCPFCSRQVANLTRSYKSINDLGARLILVTPKPLETTRRVAEFFEVDFDFWLDDGLEAGEALGLVQHGGVPSGHRGEYGEDTLWPAAVVIDANGLIQYADISRLIADRPNPEKLLKAVQAASA